MESNRGRRNRHRAPASLGQRFLVSLMIAVAVMALAVGGVAAVRGTGSADGSAARADAMRGDLPAPSLTASSTTTPPAPAESPVSNPPPTAEPSQTGEPTGSARWLAVLQSLDRRRALAWRTGHPRVLGEVYLAGSAVVRADERLLRRYLARGLTVQDARLRFRSVEPSRVRSNWVRLTVVDRLRPTRVTTRGGNTRWLPRDRPTRHVITLRRTDSGWRIATVRAG